MATTPSPEPTVGIAPDPVVAVDDVPGAVTQTPGTLKRPDITPAQIVGSVPVIAEFVHAFGIYTFSASQVTSLNHALLYGVALIGGDALIRVGRALGIGR
jgi:hypothetical protein